MDDYISREAALKAIFDSTNSFLEDEDPAKASTMIYLIATSNAREAVKCIPNADVRPVREGHWVKARGSWCTPGGDPVWECSECGKGVHVYGIEHGTYGSDIADGQWVSCPNCGAMMGGTP